MTDLSAPDDAARLPAPSSVPTAVLSGLPLALVLTNPRLEDNPIVYANAAFEKLTGHRVAAVIGRNCRFLQGPLTEPDRLERIRAAVASNTGIAIDITNHRVDGTPFLNRLAITSLGEPDECEYFLGTMSAPSDDRTRLEQIEEQLLEVHHRVKNHLSMIVSLIRMQARSSASELDFAVLSSRIEALQLLYQELSDTGVSSTNRPEVPLGAYVSRIAAAVGHLSGLPGVRVNVLAEEVMVEAGAAGRVGLLVSEILTNAFRHAFADRESGLVETRLQRLSNGTIRIQVSDDGIGLPPDHAWPAGGNLGSRIVQSLLAGLDARYAVDTSASGTTFTIDIPGPDAPGPGQ